MASTGTRAKGARRNANSDPALRRQAEAIARDTLATAPDSEDIDALSPEATRAMLHELRVHQIELEMQNEELRAAQVDLETARANYFDLYDLAPVGYCTVSESGLILQANLTAAILLGVARNTMAKQPISKYILGEDQDIFYLSRRQLLATDAPQTCELRMVKRDGARFWARLTSTVARDDRGAPVLRMALTDVTESKIMATAMQESEARYRAISEALQKKNVELENAKSTAEKSNLAKTDFLSRMSHDLRTPLNAILGFAQLIDSGATPLTPSQKHSVDRILHAGWYLLELINEILNLAQIESGKILLSPESLSLADVVRESLAMVETDAKNRGISITAPDLAPSCLVHADRTRLKEVLTNLLSNAIKYNKTGGSVVVACIDEPGERVRISVADTGCGLSPEKRAQLFQPFNRLGQESSTVKGTGIGLVVCKRLVELMAGTIGVESTEGTGSVFWIELDRSTRPHDAAAETTPIQLPANARGHTLLHVEENPANGMVVKDLVARRPDIRLLNASNASQGIEVARASLPDVILMDVNLPDISGVAATKILGEDPVTAHIPVVALNAMAIPRATENGEEAGFFRYLTTPLIDTQFMDALDAALKFSQTESVKRVHT